ncbi:MAG: DUF6067 family protein [Planctomycetota bacterium]|nr:DUF6067 family protein [Planctomycetota bacterium]
MTPFSRNRLFVLVSLALAFILCVGANPARGQVPAEPPTQGGTLAPLKKAPTIDGKIEPGEWDGAIRTVGFQDLNFRRVEPRTGTTYCGFTKDRLYIAIVSELPPTGPIARKANRDADLIWDDGIEIWLDPNRDRRAGKQGDQRFYQMICNPLGSIEDKAFDPAKGAPDNAWNGNWDFANGVDNDRHLWTAELSIPFADLGWAGSPVGKSIGVLVSRNFKMPWQQSTWFPHKGAFVSWQEYPKLTLTAEDPSFAVESLGEDFLSGQVQLRAKAFNPGPARQARVKLLITSSDMPEIKDERVLNLPADGTASYSFDVAKGRLHEEASHELTMSVVPAADKVVAGPPPAQPPIFAHSIRWTKEPTMIEGYGNVKRSQKWAVQVGPHPELAVRVAFYPSFRMVRLRLDPAALGKEFDKQTNAHVTIKDPTGQTLADTDPTWATSPGEIEFPLGKKLVEGAYTVRVTIPGFADPIDRQFTYKRFPFEGNTIGLDGPIYPPFKPIKVEGDSVDVVLRRYEVDGLGLWRQVATDGHDLLARPMSLVVDGTERLAGRGKFAPADATGKTAVFEGRAAHPAVSVATRCTTEYDGCMKVELTLAPGERKTELQSLWLEIPMRDEEAPLWHVATTSLRVNPAGATPAGQGNVWNSRKFPDGEWYGNFKPYIWLGGEERGLCWFADNDAGWVLDVDEKNPDKSAPSLVLLRDGKRLTLRVNLVQKPTTIEGTHKIVFGLMASPAKPMMKDWRNIDPAPALPGRQQLIWMGSEYWGADEIFSSKYPRNGDLSILDAMRDAALQKPVDIAAFQKGFEARNFGPTPGNVPDGEKKKPEILSLLGNSIGIFSGGRSGQFFNVYWEEFHTASFTHPETRVFQDEWSGTYGYGSVGGLVRSYQDFATWAGSLFVSRGIGLYFDNAFPKRGYDPLTTAAYRLPNGQIQPSASMWAHREYLKRIWIMHRQLAPGDMVPMMQIHMTNTHIIPYMVWNDSNLDLEWFYGPEAQQSKYAHELLRAESIGLQSGNIPIALARIERTKDDAELRIAQRTRFGAMMVHEIKIVADGEDRKLQQILADFGYGKEDCKVFNYWRDDFPLHSNDDARVKSLVLQRGKEALAVVCTWNDKPASVTFRVDSGKLGFKPKTAADGETGKPLPLDGGKITLDLAGYDVRVINLK